MPPVRSLLLSCAVLLATAAPAAAAGDPIMPLSQVGPGMRCTAYSVVQGTTISSFEADVVDVVAGDAADDAPRILMRFSGPAIDRTGVGPGFSGSPIYCDGKVIGAISESVGEYGGTLALATPIEAIIGTPVSPPAAVSPRPAGAHALATPISIAGLSGPVGRIYEAAAKRGGKVLLATPGQPRPAAFPVQQLTPGASMSAGLSSGDVTAGSIGTVTYVDGGRVWAFGHPLEGTGRRSLFLQDAYVYTVVNNPVGIEGAGTYKLAAPGHDVGILSSDGLSAVAGQLGAAPASFPMKVIARDEDTGRQRVIELRIADETALELPSGASPLSLVGSSAVASAAATILGSTPSRETGEMCVRITVAERKAPLRFCNRYLSRGASGDTGETLGVGAPMTTDFVDAVTAVDEFNFKTLHITGVEANIKIRRGLRQAFLLDAEGPAVVHRGRKARVRVKVEEVRGPARWRTLNVYIPKNVPRGERDLVLEGTPSDAAAGLEVDLGALLFGSSDASGDGSADATDEAGPRTLDGLAKSVADVSRYDGVTASFLAPGTSQDDLSGSGAGHDRHQVDVLRDPDARLSGTVQIPVIVER